MKVVSVLLLCFVLAVSAQSWDSSSWTDSLFGGTLYLCVDDDDVHGAYSEYGVLHGTRNGDKITGEWYEPQYSGATCNNGDFEWELNSNGSAFTGFWTCADDDDERDWSETFISGPSSSSDVLCARFDHGDDVEGSYTLTTASSSFFDICIDDDEYEAAFGSSGSNTDGSESGVVFENGAVVSGEYEVENGVTGVSLVFRLRDGRLGNFFWRYDDNDQINTVTDYNTSAHGYDLYNRNGNASDNDCKGNDNSSSSRSSNTSNSSSSNSSDDDDSSSSNSSDDDDSSSAITLVASVFFVIAAALI